MLRITLVPFLRDNSSARVGLRGRFVMETMVVDNGKMTETDKYLAKYRACEQAKGEADAVVKKFKILCESLERWQTLLLIGGQKQNGTDETRVTELPITQIPTIDQLDAALAAWHDTRKAVERMWEVLPPDLRIGLKEPPKIPS